jgi:hypothetical protein
MLCLVMSHYVNHTWVTLSLSTRRHHLHNSDNTCRRATDRRLRSLIRWSFDPERYRWHQRLLPHLDSFPLRTSYRKKSPFAHKHCHPSMSIHLCCWPPPIRASWPPLRHHRYLQCMLPLLRGILLLLFHRLPRRATRTLTVARPCRLHRRQRSHHPRFVRRRLFGRLD